MAAKVAYEFGGFRFEPANARLTYGSTVIPLTLKAADTLAVLVRQPDALVSKEELMAAVWPDTAVEENNLNQQISALRRALSQNGNGSFIETVPRRGYRFVGTVRTVSLNDSAAPVRSALAAAVAEQLEEPSPASGPARRFGQKRQLAVIGAAMLLVTAGTAAGWRWYEQQTVIRESAAAIARGKELMRRGDARSAAVEFQHAVTLDPTNALAYGSLAHALHKQSFHDSVVRVAGASPSVSAAARAVSLDPDCASCHGTFGFFLFYHDWEWVKAEEHLRVAIRLAPEQEDIRPPYAMLLAATGRLREAQAQIDFALAKQPYQLTWRVIRATILYLQRRYHEAIAAADEALTLNDDERGAWEWRSRALFQLGRREEAVRALAQVAFVHDSVELDRAVREGGGDGGLRRLLARTDAWPGPVEQSWRRGPWRALLNQHDEALTELERALEYRNFNLIYVAVDPVFDSLREHPRFRRIVSTMGLDPWFGRPEEMVRHRSRR
jgi:DNA-binding winged helix-turn-helix (wHTH) protein/Tfp pilus assembly protein PilF